MTIDPDAVPTEYEYAHVRSDDAAKWIGRDGWERTPATTVTLRRPKPITDPYERGFRDGVMAHARQEQTAVGQK